MKIALNQEDLTKLSPSPFVRRFGTKLVAAANGKPILDVACGGGRNAIFLAHLGGHVICIDNDLTRLEEERIRLADTPFAPAFSNIEPFCLDLKRDEWPFSRNSIGGIVNVHFLHVPLLPPVATSLMPGKYFFLETISGRGGNWRELPKTGTVRSMVEPFLALELYKERKVGPSCHQVATVRMLGKRLNS